jgi:glycosyltransferase involved in cell wall biosynthesis
MPAVSVIIPVFNRPSQLRRALESVLAQSFDDFEIIVVDDGSTEDLWAKVPALGQPRVRYIRQQNQGTGAARNKAVEAARGEYISFLDSDDVFLEDNLKLLYEQLGRQPGAAVAHGWSLLVDQAGRETQRTRPELVGRVPQQYLISNPTPVGTLLIRRQCFEAGHRFDANLPLYEDWDLWMRLAFHYDFSCVRARVARIVFHEGQRSTSRPAVEVARVLRTIYQKLLSDPETAPIVRRRWADLMANTHVMTGHQYRVFEGNKEAARREFWTAIRMAPRFAPAYVGMAEAYLGTWALQRLQAVRSRLFAASR